MRWDAILKLKQGLQLLFHILDHTSECLGSMWGCSLPRAAGLGCGRAVGFILSYSLLALSSLLSLSCGPLQLQACVWDTSEPGGNIVFVFQLQLTPAHSIVPPRVASLAWQQHSVHPVIGAVTAAAGRHGGLLLEPTSAGVCHILVCAERWKRTA